MLDLTEGEIGYLAGLLDGEGTFTILRQRTGVYPMLVVSMTSEAAIAFVADKLGYRYRAESMKNYSPNWNQCFRVQVYGRKAQKLCEIMLPHLIVKRRHAEILIAFPYPDLEREAVRRGDTVVAEEIAREREALLAELRTLNQRGRGIADHRT